MRDDIMMGIAITLILLAGWVFVAFSSAHKLHNQDSRLNLTEAELVSHHLRYTCNG